MVNCKNEGNKFEGVVTKIHRLPSIGNHYAAIDKNLLLVMQIN